MSSAGPDAFKRAEPPIGPKNPLYDADRDAIHR